MRFWVHSEWATAYDVTTPCSEATSLHDAFEIVKRGEVYKTLKYFKGYKLKEPPGPLL